jgi:hypothetical protein
MVRLVSGSCWICLRHWEGADGPDGIDVMRPVMLDLAAVVAAWPTLPGPIRAGILAMVKAAGDRGKGGPA